MHFPFYITLIQNEKVSCLLILFLLNIRSLPSCLLRFGLPICEFRNIMSELARQLVISRSGRICFSCQICSIRSSKSSWLWTRHFRPKILPIQRKICFISRISTRTWNFVRRYFSSFSCAVKASNATAFVFGKEVNSFLIDRKCYWVYIS